MTLSYLLKFVWLATPAACWAVNAAFARRRLHECFVFLMVWSLCYVLLLATVAAVNADLEREMYSYDLNGDGSVDGYEMTPDAVRAEEAFIHDTGRALAPITGIPITFIWTTINLIVLSTVRFVWRKLLGRPDPPESEDDDLIVDLPAAVETGNPYQSPTAGKMKPR